MSIEENFLEVYQTVLDQNLTEFYASELEPEMDTSAGNIGRTIYRILDKYDLPIQVERESPSDPSLFKLEEELEYSEIEEMLDSAEPNESQLDKMFKEAKNHLSGLYEDQELNSLLREVAENYYDNLGDRLQNMGRLKQKLQEEGEIKGNTIDGWRSVDK